MYWYAFKQADPLIVASSYVTPLSAMQKASLHVREACSPCLRGSFPRCHPYIPENLPIIKKSHLLQRDQATPQLVTADCPVLVA